MATDMSCMFWVQDNDDIAPFSNSIITLAGGDCDLQRLIDLCTSQGVIVPGIMPLIYVMEQSVRIMSFMNVFNQYYHNTTINVNIIMY